MAIQDLINSTFALITLSITIVYVLSKLLLIGRRPKNYPPGPPTLPILGNLHQIPSHDTHKQFQRWAQKYGPMYSLMLGTKTYVVLSSDVVVKDLLDKRSAIYSDRPDLYTSGELLSGGMRVLMMVRKMVHNFANITAAKQYEPYQVLENKQMLNDLLETPEDFLFHFRRYSNSVTTSMIYSWRAPIYNDPTMQKFFDVTIDRIKSASTVTGALIDYFPLLRSLPDAFLSSRRHAKAVHMRELSVFREHWLSAKQNVISGSTRSCMCVDIVQEQKDQGLNDDLAAYMAGALLGAGSDTTSNTLYAFAQAMVVFPKVQKKAQAAIDAVIGPNRLPTMDDESNPGIQYIRGCVKESLRWMPTTLLGAVPHAATKDDTYMGYHIPAGAGVVLNTYGIHMDPVRYPNPRTFDPDRFTNDTLSAYDSLNIADVSKRDHFTFGAGRRACPGMHIAERSLYLGISRMLWAFDFSPALDAEGKEMMPDIEKLTPGLVASPVAFQARITPREGRAEIIRREWNEAKEEELDERAQWKSEDEEAAMQKRGAKT